MCDEKFVVYLRVSTQKQGASGLGLEAQSSAVQSYVKAHGDKIIETFIEVESGKRSDRPKLAEAIDACHVYGARLLIARLDRLSRNAAFLLNLRDSGVRFTCCDMPEANEMVIGIMAVMAQHEAELISKRTKAALGEAKKRGTKLGGLRPGHVALDGSKASLGLSARQSKAAARADRLKPIVDGIRKSGINTPSGIAKALTARGVPAPRGGAWQAIQVQRLGV